MIHFLVKGERRPRNSAYVDHPSIWACPRGWDVAQYTLWILNQPIMLRHLHTLRDKTLCLYARPGVAITHAHILEALAKLTTSSRKSLILDLSQHTGDDDDQADQSPDRLVRKAGRSSRQDLPRSVGNPREAARPQKPQQARSGQQLPEQGKQSPRQRQQRRR